MRRRIVTVSGSITQIVMAEGMPLRLETPALAVTFVGQSLALAILPVESGEKNLVIIGPAGDEIKRLGTTCGTGELYEVLEVDGEIRVIEATPRGDFQARLDLASLELERVAAWR